MLKAVVEEHGASALRLKDAYVNNPKRTEQLLDTFPMSSALKKVCAISPHAQLKNERGYGSAVPVWGGGREEPSV